MNFAETHRYVEVTAKRCHSPRHAFELVSAAVVEFES